MNKAKQIYSLLLRLYPEGYRKTFGGQMLQTFSDSYRDVQETEGSVGAGFWFATLTDEIKNITEQHRLSLMEENTFLKVTVLKAAVSGALLLPLFVLFYAALIKVALAIPHPPVSGFGFLLALAMLVLIPGVLSLAASRFLAGAVVSVLFKREVGVA